MGLSWTGIVNTAKHAVTVTESEIGKAAGVVGKDINSAIKIFIRIEPVAVSALTPFFPEIAPVVGFAYTIAENVENDLTATGATKLQMATGIFTDAIIPAAEAGLNAAGKTIDSVKVAAIAPDLFNAIVAENNAQAEIAALLQEAATNKTIPDPAALAKAESDVALAVAQVKSLGTAIQAAVSTIAPSPVKTS